MNNVFTLAFEMTPNMWAVIAAVGIVLLGVAWFGIRFWLASTRPANIKEVQTPNLDRMNQRALAALGEDDDEEEEAPEELQRAVDGSEREAATAE